ncbi:hypothetical protein K461DRAFT_270592 [Myriangium duriaei CBS 260.36]|uniref:Uncharacterized protein n=1 Tax=Myriangium duriaei CBS 260.36 TaxID=1168546 RepID=A0A9P4MED3_9PEZI|nr:hypothetical protein K461DRAFT_270592 [Myriangium duriaei CBS 260.36]
MGPHSTATDTPQGPKETGGCTEKPKPSKRHPLETEPRHHSPDSNDGESLSHDLHRVNLAEDRSLPTHQESIEFRQMLKDQRAAHRISIFADDQDGDLLGTPIRLTSYHSGFFNQHEIEFVRKDGARNVVPERMKRGSTLDADEVPGPKRYCEPRTPGHLRRTFNPTDTEIPSCNVRRPKPLELDLPRGRSTSRSPRT